MQTRHLCPERWRWRAIEARGTKTMSYSSVLCHIAVFEHYSKQNQPDPLPLIKVRVLKQKYLGVFVS